MENWKKKLENLFKTRQQQEEDQKQKRKEDDTRIKAKKDESISFIFNTVIVAFNELKAELEKYNMTVSIEQGDVSAGMTIRPGQVRQMVSAEKQEFQYGICVSYGPTSATPVVTCSSVDRHNIKQNGQVLNIADISKEDIIQDFIEAYKKQRKERKQL